MLTAYIGIQKKGTSKLELGVAEPTRNFNLKTHIFELPTHSIFLSCRLKTLNKILF